MIRLISLVVTAASCFAVFACATHTQSASPSGLVISNVTIVSPERVAPLEHAYLRILNGKIAELSERPLRGETAIDGTGRYLTPGLIDSHVHLAVAPGFPSGMTAKQAAAHPEIVAAALEQDPKSYLFFGFTTLVDLFGTAQRTERWNALELRPDAYFCGGAVVIDGQLRLIPTPHFSYEQPPAERAPTVSATQNALNMAVARMVGDGAICVKTIYERGLKPTVEETQRLVAAAHAHNLPVFIHANSKDAQAFAVATGVDLIVHGMWNGWELTGDAGLPTDVEGILSDVVKRQVGYQPTIQVVVGLRDMIRSGYLSRPDLADAYPTTLIDWYATEEGGWYAEEIRKYPGFKGEAGFRESIDRVSRATRFLAKANARLLFGSDTPSDSVYTNPPGLNGRLEMNNWIAAGVSKAKLFRALTVDNARMLRLDKQIGTVEPGKVANLLLLHANPLDSVEAYDTVDMVFLHGRPIPRAELSAREASAVSANTPAGMSISQSSVH